MNSFPGQILDQRLELFNQDALRYNLPFLHIIARAGTPEEVRSLIEAGAEMGVDKVKRYRQSQKAPIHEAAIAGNADNVIALAQLGTPIGFPDSEGRTAMHYAAYLGHVNVILAIAQFMANFPIETKSTILDPVDDDGNTPLLLATIRANTPNEEQERRINLPITIQRGAISPYLRVRNGASPAETISLLLQLGSRMVDYPNKKYVSPLNSAMAYCQLEVVEVLIRAGSRAQDFPDEDRNFPLHRMSYLRDFDMLSVEYGLSHTIYEPEVLAQRQATMVEFLIQNGVQNIDSISNRGETPLFNSTWMDQIDVLKILLKYGSRAIDLGMHTLDGGQVISIHGGNTPLWQMIEQNAVEMVKFLLRAGSQSVTRLNQFGATPIEYVVNQIIELEHRLQGDGNEEGEGEWGGEDDDEDREYNMEELGKYRDMLIVLRSCGVRPPNYPGPIRSQLRFNRLTYADDVAFIARSQQLMTDPIPDAELYAIRNEIYFQPLVTRVLDAIIDS